jgi:Calx-beta domain-containing protein/FG-GAP repeat protein
MQNGSYMIRTALSLGVLLGLAACGGGGSDTLPAVNPNGGNAGAADAGQIQFSTQAYSASEGDTNAVISITRTGGSSGAVSVRIRSSDLTATSGQDYTPVDTIVEFANADTAAKTVSVPLTNDTTVEGPESLQLALSEPSGGAKVGTAGTAVVTIADNDVAPPAAPRASTAVITGAVQVAWTESGGATSYTVSIDSRGKSAFAPVGAALPASQRSLTVPIAAHKLDWATAKFRVAACNAAGCTDSDTVGIQGGVASSPQAIGFIKASNTIPYQQYGGAAFGSAVAFSADGNTLAVGAIYEESGATGVNGNQVSDCSNGTNCVDGSGAVYVFARATDGSWSQQAYIKASRANIYATFGEALALSADGNTLAVGASGESSASKGVDGAQGYNCSSPATNCSTSSGAVYVFTRGADGMWAQQSYIKASNTADYARFGSAVALSADGNLLVAGARYESSAVSNSNGTAVSDCGQPTPVNCDSSSGAAYVFARSQNAWTQQAFIKAPYTNGSSSYPLTLGSSLALSADGLILALGAPGESSASAGIGGPRTNDCGATTPSNCRRDSGAAFVFTKSGSSWNLNSFIKASNPSEFVNFGQSIALSADGAVMAIGDPYEESGAVGVGGNPVNDCDAAVPVTCEPDSGAVYVFTQAAGAWAQDAYIKASNARSYMEFGSTLALSGDGSTLAVASTYEASAARGLGGDQADVSMPDAGAVYVFGGGASAWSQLNYVKASNTNRDLRFGQSLALTTDGNTLAVGGAGDDAPSTGIGADQRSACDDPTPSQCSDNSGAVYLY